MSIHVLVFGPTPFVESLISLSLTNDLVTQVGVEPDANDAQIYENLLAAIDHHVDDDPDSLEQILILTPQMGGVYSTVALSMPRKEVYVISGVNVDMLSSLSLNEKVFNLYSLGIIHTPHLTISETKRKQAESMLNELQVRNAIYTLSDELCHQSKYGILLLNNFLREEGEDSNIDASILETDFSQIL